VCKILEVSTSGYYRFIQAEKHRQQTKEHEMVDYELIKQHFDRSGGKAGALTIKMKLERHHGVVMNHKKIRRIMRAYHLVATVRQANPYRKLARATQEHFTCPNHLNRQFNQYEPEKVMLTDITYLNYGNGQCAYLSCVKDGATREILAYHVSSSISMNLVTETLNQLFDRLQGNIHPEATFHSDQGFHYTHPSTQKTLRENGIKQSMSRKGNCLDNASMESFFGHMKDEMSVDDCQTIEEVRQRVSGYMTYYNSERPQWTLKKMTPNEFRSHLIAC
jgi:transposase InsO family protein